MSFDIDFRYETFSRTKSYWYTCILIYKGKIHNLFCNNIYTNFFRSTQYIYFYLDVSYKKIFQFKHRTDELGGKRCYVTFTTNRLYIFNENYIRCFITFQKYSTDFLICVQDFTFMTYPLTFNNVKEVKYNYYFLYLKIKYQWV